jgi:hypothetical protein
MTLIEIKPMKFKTEISGFEMASKKKLTPLIRNPLKGMLRLCLPNGEMINRM